MSCDDVHKPQDIKAVLKEVRHYFRFSYTNTSLKYFNVPCSFDIETTSFFRATGNGEQKVATMYEWTFGIYGAVIIGRTWDEFTSMIQTLASELNLNSDKRLVIYVHNLAYEFQFMRKWLAWTKIFSIDNRKPVYAITIDGIEFRCSYLLSGYSLAKLGDDLRTYTIKKLIGELDYEKMRHSLTVLTDAEIAYCINDVKIVMAYIAERIEQDGEISKIPLTKTGYIRNYCRNSCFYEVGISRKKSFKRVRYMDIMRGLRLASTEYDQLKNAFQGGFTHANPFYTGKVMQDVTSYDFTSSYPCVMIAEKFPMGSSEKIEITSNEDFERNLKLYCCLFDIEIFGLQSQLWIDSYISISRCKDVKKAVVNNGRIVSAEHLITTVTEQDFLIIRKFYTWDKIRVGNFRRYKKDYLPTDFVKAILKLYHDKTTLKGVEGAEIEYLRSKEMLNACYGMAVTDIVREEYKYINDEWCDPDAPDKDDIIQKYNNNRGRFLFYPWGVWVTAYARRNLFTGILEFGEDYIYSDTDSVKVRHAENHIKYIEEYNSRIRDQLCRAMDYHDISHEAIEPLTKNGIKKCLGVWDFDGHYEQFKTLGAKRYIVKYSDDERNKNGDRGKINITVSGLNKQICVPWMLAKWGEKGVFEHFDADLYVPPEYTGKMTHTYIDDAREGVLIDYNGVPCKYRELSSVHLEKADYSLSISREYSDYFLGIQTNEI